MFDRLVELVHVVSKNKVSRIEIIGDASNYNTLVHQLYDGIQTGKFDTIEAAAAELYNSQPNNKNFKHLLYTLEKRLLNTLFFIDVNKPNYNQLAKAYYTCQKNVAAVNILAGKTANQIAISLAERTIRKAIQFEFTDIVVNLARYLKIKYAGDSSKSKKYLFYKSILEEYRELLDAEIYAEDCHQYIVYVHAKSGVSERVLLEKAIRQTNQLKKILDKFHSYRFKYIAYSAIVMQYEMAQEFDRVIEICNEALDFFKSNPSRSSNTPIFNFSTKIAASQTVKKNYDAAQLAIKDCLSLVTEGGQNWYLVLFYHFILSMHSKNYQKAYELILTAQNHKNYTKLPPNIKEVWEVYAAYVHYFIRIEKINPIEINGKKLRKFRYYKFLNEVPIYSKDKRGINISILILQTIFLLQAKKYDVMIERIDALKQYCYKYLKKNDSYRSNCFIQMLIKLVEAHFHKVGAIRKANAYLQKLKAYPMEISLQTSEVEIVPYEDLWQHVIDSVEAEFKYIKPKKQA